MTSGEILREILQDVFDQMIRDTTEEVAGIRLYQVNAPPDSSSCTVYVKFERGLQAVLALNADMSMFTRLTQYMLQSDTVTLQDVEDFTKEYFNVLCGRIAGRLFRATKIALRFGIPAFYADFYQPDDYKHQFAIHYSTDQNETAWLTYYTPKGIENGAGIVDESEVRLS